MIGYRIGGFGYDPFKESKCIKSSKHALPEAVAIPGMICS